MLGGYRITSIIKLKMLGGYPRINSKNMHHVNPKPCTMLTQNQKCGENIELRGQISFFSGSNHVLQGPNQVFTPNFPIEGVTHIVNPCCWCMINPYIIKALLCFQPLHITFLLNFEGGEPLRRGGCM